MATYIDFQEVIFRLSELIPLTNSQYVWNVSSLWNLIWLYNGCTDKTLFRIKNRWVKVSNIKISKAAPAALLKWDNKVQSHVKDAVIKLHPFPMTFTHRLHAEEKTSDTGLWLYSTKQLCICHPDLSQFPKSIIPKYHNR
jgi:hypothetical protein